MVTYSSLAAACFASRSRWQDVPALRAEPDGGAKALAYFLPLWEITLAEPIAGATHRFGK
jgi:hypothetical protein